MKEECSVCVGEYLNIISCKYCDYKTCKKCFNRYLLDSIGNAKCMNCKKEYVIDYLIDICSKKTVLDYNKNRLYNIFEREISLLPSTQIYSVEYKKRKDEIKKIEENLIELNNNIKNEELIKSELIKYIETNVFINKKYNIDDDIIMEKALKIVDINELLLLINEQIIINNNSIYRQRNLLLSFDQYFSENMDNLTKFKTGYIRNCPVNDCRGFLSSALKCDLCNIYVCSKCNNIKKTKYDNEHVCNEDDIKTVELLKKEVKQCPNCSINIYKISGCNQMWCVNCKVAFCWRTGEIMKGVIHNPHYFDWMRQRRNNVQVNQNVNNNDCNTIITFDTLIRLYKNKSNIKILNELYQHFCEINEVIRTTYINYNTLNNNDIINLYRKYRILYLANEITKDEWKMKILKKQKELDKKTDINHLLQLFITVVNDLFRTLDVNSLINVYNQINEIRLHVNKCFEKLNKRYDNNMPFIYPNLNIYVFERSDNKYTKKISNKINIEKEREMYENIINKLSLI
jgi:hypothetical protein